MHAKHVLHIAQLHRRALTMVHACFKVCHNYRVIEMHSLTLFAWHDGTVSIIVDLQECYILSTRISRPSAECVHV